MEKASESQTDIADDKVFVEGIWEELLQGAIWEFSFDVHRAAKLSYLFLDPALDPNVDLENGKDLEQSVKAEKDASEQKAKSKDEIYNLLCPNCKKPCTSAAIGKHLIACLGIGGRVSSRAASRKITSGIDEIDDDDNSNSGSSRKTKKSQGKIPSQKANTHGCSSKTSLENANFEEITYEERKEFFKQKCGVITKTNKMCMNSHKCTQHTDEEKGEIRHCLLRDMGEQLISDGQIDVDTVDDGNCGYLFS